MHLRNMTKLTLAAVSVVAFAPVVLADTITTVETTTVKEPAKVVTTTVQATAPRQSNYLKRLTRIEQQINMGESKGWLSFEQAADLKARHKVLVDKEAAFFTAGYGTISKADGDCLEKEINGLNISVTRTMSSSVASKSSSQL